MFSWGALWRLTGLSYMQGVCALASGKGGRVRVVPRFWWPSLPVFSPGAHGVLLSRAEGEKLSVPKQCSASGPLPRYECSSERAREDLDAPKSPAQDQQRQPRLDFN